MPSQIVYLQGNVEICLFQKPFTKYYIQLTNHFMVSSNVQVYPNVELHSTVFDCRFLLHVVLLILLNAASIYWTLTISQAHCIADLSVRLENNTYSVQQAPC